MSTFAKRATTTGNSVRMARAVRSGLKFGQLRGPRVTKRRALVPVAALVLALIGTAAWAFWSTTGAGVGAATTGTLNAPTATTVSSTAGSGSVSVSWTAPSGGVAPTGYRVSRVPSSGPVVAACGTSSTLVTSTACTDSAVPDGTYTYVVTAVRGSWSTSGANSGAVTVTNTVATTTAVASSASPSVVGQTVTYTATVTQASGATKPPGTVTFEDGASTITCAGGNQTLSNGTATCSLAYTGTGSHSITAVYAGSGVFTGSTSSALAQTVTAAGTTTGLVSATNPSRTGETVTFTATVAAVSPGSGTPTGTVAFNDGASPLNCTGGSQTLNGSGVATCQVPFGAAGTKSIVAAYAGSSNYLASSSPGVSQVVNAASTTTTVATSANPSNTGQTVTYTATVSAAAPGGGTPTGTVAFKDGVATIAGCGSQALSGGTATCSLAYASAGSHTITAIYAGSADYTTSTSGSLSQTVSAASTTTALTSSANPSVSGQSVTFTATVAAVSPGSGTPTGSVAFKDGAATITGCGSQALSGGSATCAVSTLSAGSHSITAVFAGTTDYLTSTSAPVNQVVNAPVATTTSLTTSQTPAKTGSSVTYTATVAPASPVPTGTVTFQDGGNPIVCADGDQTLNAARVATCQMTYPSMGSHSITAVYSGDSTYAASTSSAVTQRVVNSAVTGLGFANVVAGSGSGSPVTLNSSNCTGLGTANVVCTISNGNNTTLAADLQFVNSSNTLTAYSAESVQGSSAIETKNGTTNSSVTFGTTGSASPRLTGTKNGNDHVYFTVTYTDGVNTFTATLKMN